MAKIQAKRIRCLAGGCIVTRSIAGAVALVVLALGTAVADPSLRPTEDASGDTLVVSGTGSASCESRTCVAVSGLGDASCGGFAACAAVSGAGDAEGSALAASALGSAEATLVAASGVGSASAQGVYASAGQGVCDPVVRTRLLCAPPSEWVGASVDGDASGRFVAVSAFGNASGGTAPTPFGGPLGAVAVSGSGDSVGVVALSGSGASSGFAAASGAGASEGGFVAASVLGDASCERGLCAGAFSAAGDASCHWTVCVGASGAGHAEGWVGLSVLGDATSCSRWGVSIAGCYAVSALGDASGLFAVSGTGHATGSIAASACDTLSGLGHDALCVRPALP